MSDSEKPAAPPAAEEKKTSTAEVDLTKYKVGLFQWSSLA